MRRLVLAVVLLLPACSTGRTTSSTVPAADAAAPVHAVLNDIVVAWNRDDLAGHVAGYTADASYTQPNGLMVGRPAIQEMLRRSFARPDGLAGELSFGDVNVRMIGEMGALATGSFTVAKMPGMADIKGRFTLVFQRTAEGWKIIHDHSS